MTIHLPKKKEAQKLSKFIKKIICTTPGYSLEAIKFESSEYNKKGVLNKITDKDHIILLSEQKGIINGFAHGKMDFGTCWLNWIGVDPLLRTQGLGAQLLKFVEKKASQRGSHKIWLDTKESNIKAIHFFKSNGYNKMAKLNDHWYRGNFILWEKFLIQKKTK